ncbi:helix-turn-helix domain-containing protein [Paenibacillus eucommiae]|uniref:Cytoskeletal protein RodZ n=1 Tax=Paenibacillus eucommiae TaxID=1355755 RepID=A0ABS4IUK5_9BACL|nr:RodZ domain-containing protein [Paenibacillus eucommiae]MBP1991268.1 cytoskeletal protein RodZ [Paenibacillus eucommiae]
MSELGSILKKARLDQKITLDDMEETTKIRKRYLEAIEEGNYKVLPGSFYVRAFIKNYAEAVGLDPTEVLSLYQTTVPTDVAEKTVVDNNLRKKRHGTRNTDKLSRLASSVMVVGFVVLILGLIYFYAFQTPKKTSDGGDPSDNKPTRITDQTNVSTNTPNSTDGTLPGGQLPTSTPVPTPTPTPALTEVKFSNSEKGIDYYTVTGVEKLNIQLKIVGADCWVRIDSVSEDNTRKLLKQTTYKDGDTDSFELETSAYLHTGAAKALELSVNGTIVPVGDSLNPKKIQLNLQKN